MQSAVAPPPGVVVAVAVAAVVATGACVVGAAVAAVVGAAVAGAAVVAGVVGAAVVGAGTTAVVVTATVVVVAAGLVLVFDDPQPIAPSTTKTTPSSLMRVPTLIPLRALADGAHASAKREAVPDLQPTGCHSVSVSWCGASGGSLQAV